MRPGIEEKSEIQNMDIFHLQNVQFLSLLNPGTLNLSSYSVSRLYPADCLSATAADYRTTGAG
jgi:hypothetical protein